tara:strand:+ start:41 stop:514 length:474 start_codon:yes stop_codon:yes gene_type:complete
MNFISPITGSKNYYTLLVCILVASLFLFLAVYIYVNYLKPGLNPSYVPNKEYINKNDIKKTSGDLYFFYAEWCPYSKKALKTINDYKVSNPKIEDVVINYKFIKDETDDANITNFEKEYGKKIEGYPTIYFIYNNQVIEFDATITKDNLNTFFSSVL